MNLKTKISEIPGIGFFYSSRLKKLDIYTLKDLMLHYPFRYQEFGEQQEISNLELGQKASVKVQILGIKNIYTRFGKKLTTATVNDGKSTLEAVWFNQHFLARVMPSGAFVSLAGRVDLFSGKPTLINPEYEILKRADQSSIHTEGLISVYPETSGVSSKWIRTKIKKLLPPLLNQFEEFLPKESLQRNNLIELRRAIWQVHFPASQEQKEEARRRLAFNELLITSLKILRTKESWKNDYKSVKLKIDREKTLDLVASLPFRLTDSQTIVLKEILSDLELQKPMNRILQGDVGSGKTIVAAIAAYNAYLNGYQTALMAPTTILAEQHYNTLRAVLQPHGLKVGLKTSEKKQEGNFDIIVGTHALITDKAGFNNLALVVVDEQHRFGVKQRSTLRKKGKTPHVLTMTATPIPRSLALTLYGELDISTLDELPPGRRKVKTFVVPPTKRAGAYEFIRKEVKEGNQVFILCPLIEESESLVSVKAATVEFERLRKEVFPKLNLGLLHGRMKGKEKQDVLEKLRANEINILVSTPVVEVGIDIPGATIMMIEAAERFGLASLHQLRGRVGRSNKQSYCLLFTESSSEKVLKRLGALEKHHLGSKLAEIDLKTRGPGEIYGTSQSGLPVFKIASLSDTNLLQDVQREAVKLHKATKSKKLKSLDGLLDKVDNVSPD